MWIAGFKTGVPEPLTLTNPIGGFMKTMKTEKYRMLARVADVASEHASLFPKKTAAAPLTAAIRSAVDKMSACRTTEAAVNAKLQACTDDVVAKRKALRGQIDGVHRVAEVT
jgi:hypothetical protein